MSEPIQARLAQGIAIASSAAPPEWMMWMPGGTHTIKARKGSRSIKVTVEVTPQTAQVAQAVLTAALQASKHRPYFDFDHDEAAAAAWPLEFAWRESPKPGVWARVEWSKAGAQAVTGKEYRTFSPAFFLDDESGTKAARVVDAPMAMGGLVNDPAYRDMEPLWTSGRVRGDTNTKGKTMDENETSRLEVAAAQSRILELETENAALKAGTPDNTEEIKAKEQEIESLKAKLAEAEVAQKLRQKRDAETIVKSAVARGAIAPKDEALQAKWRGLIEQDPAQADLLNKIPGSAAIQAQRLTQPAGNGHQIQVIRPDQRDTLRGYLAAKNDHRRRGEIYRADIDPILAKGERIAFERLPIQAENVLGTLVGDIVSQRTLATLVSLRPMLNDLVTDFSDAQARLDQTVYTRTIGLPAVQNFGSAASDSAVVDYPVTLDAHKQTLFTFTAAEYLSTGRNLVAEHSNALAVAIGNHLVDTVAALITDAFTSETTGAAGNKTFSDITTGTKALNLAGAPDYDRNMWINADFAEALSNDEVMDQFAVGQASAYSRWQNCKGFSRITEYPALPGNSFNLIGFGFQRNALLLTTRVAVDPSSILGAGYPGTIEVVSDPVTGLAVVNNLWIDASTLAVNSRMILLYGVARGTVGSGHKYVTT